MAPITLSSASTVLATTAQTSLERLKKLIVQLWGPNSTSLFPFIPKSIKLFVLLIFFLNRRALPFAWHIKLFTPALKMHYQLFMNRAPHASRRHLTTQSYVNKSPFEVVSVVHSYAGFEDCDYNNHLSNSCYAKNVDHARMRAVIDMFLPSIYDGFFMPLGGAHYQFIREIKMGTPYEIRTVIGGWEDKWLFWVHYFVSYPKGKKSRHHPSATPKPSNKGFPNITAPSSPSLMPKMLGPNVSFSLSDKNHLPEGAVVHCVAISDYCVKLGRITVPPKVALIASGYGDASKRRWSRVQDLRYAKAGSSLSAFGAIIPPPESKSKGKKNSAVKNLVPTIYKGGWKTDKTSGPGFWDLDEYEAQRVENMEKIFGGLHDTFGKLKAKVSPTVSPK